MQAWDLQLPSVSFKGGHSSFAQAKLSDKQAGGDGACAVQALACTELCSADPALLLFGKVELQEVPKEEAQLAETEGIVSEAMCSCATVA